MAHPLTQVENFNYEILNKELDLDFASAKDVQHLLAAYLDDFWQNGTGTTLLPSTTGPFAGDLDRVFEKRYVFRNVIKEVVERTAGAFFAKNPNWRFRQDGQDIDDEQDDETLKEISKALNQFWTKQKVSEVFKRALEARLVYGRGGLRIYIPAKFKRLNATQTAESGPSIEGVESEDYVEFPSPLDALAAMRVEYISPVQGKLLDDGGEFFSIVRYSVREDWETKRDVNIIEFSFVDDQEVTYIGLIKENDAPGSILETALSTGFDLNGKTTYNEFKGKPFVTQALYRLNQLVNLALTCAGFALVDNGFGEMVLTNVDLETEEVMGPSGEMVRRPKKLRRGGGVTQNFVGLETYDDATGTATRTTPGVTFKEPGQLQSFKDGFDLGYEGCLQEASQLYALISGDAVASGESRIQALTDFILKINPYKAEVDEMGSWLLTAITRWAFELSGQTSNGLSVAYDSKVHVAQLSTDEKNTVMAMRKDGVISRETERVLLGIDDPELEEELIIEEQKGSPDEIPTETFGERLDQVLKLIGVPGVDQDTALKYLGFTDVKIQAMKDNTAQQEADLQARIAELGGGPNPPNPGDNPPPEQGAGVGAGAGQ